MPKTPFDKEIADIRRRAGLTEMPVRKIVPTDLGGDIQAVPDNPTRDVSSFPDRRDWAQVSKPALQARAIKSLHRTPIDMDLYFYRLPGIIPHYGVTVDVFSLMSEEGIHGVYHPSEIKRLQKYLGVIDLPPAKRDVATVLFFQHQSADHMMTPWIMMHRIAHAFEEQVEEIMITAVTDCGLGIDVLDSISEFYTMKSAKKAALADITESYNELFTQFLYTGSVKLEVPADFWNTVNAITDREFARNLITTSERLNNIEELLNERFQNILNDCIGKYVVAF